ncbi:GATA-binding transcription factor [Heterostelium album PN500]|uniref:GATA-binding transcription factor n=1 Tax=Heterostelium pallidum (strain ATCC 26659 / Pp 5 / PN500) TaxID=670386 RepID=D3BRF0_HETP5|nr:GATA-binding transcription factor [Heterostelium album PN500]EFA75982.1 GATA-binding transcription factor [Heterostelium album PN500]|eukprot:XP_020428116.1 GATA-binding transcription factor [Heterostelium album PN500]
MTTVFKYHFPSSGNKSKILDLTIHNDYIDELLPSLFTNKNSAPQHQKITKSHSLPQFYFNTNQKQNDLQIEEIDSPRNNNNNNLSRNNLSLNNNNNYNNNINNNSTIGNNFNPYINNNHNNFSTNHKITTSQSFSTNSLNKSSDNGFCRKYFGSSDDESENITSFEEESSDDFYLPSVQSTGLQNLQSYFSRSSSNTSSTSTSPTASPSTSPGQQSVQFEYLKSQLSASSPTVPTLKNKKKNHQPTKVAPYSNTEKLNHREKKRGRPPKERFGHCAKCETTETPEWRRGPDGETSLCNACGLQYAKQMRKERESSTVATIGSLSNILN